MTHSPLEFVFLVANENTQKHRALLCIDKLKDSYKWSFVKEHDDERTLETFYLENYADVFIRLRHMLYLLKLDTDPYVSMAINFPGLPSVVIDPSGDFSINRLMKSIVMIFTNWPTIEYEACPCDESDDDECEEEEECEEECEEYEEEDAYADMPPLVNTESEKFATWLRKAAGYSPPSSPILNASARNEITPRCNPDECHIECECYESKQTRMEQSRTAPFDFPPVFFPTYKRMKNFHSEQEDSRV